MNGVPTPADVEVEFRKHYLVTGSTRGAARKAGLPVSTAHDLATRANADPEFVQARTAMYARAVPDAERMLIAGMEIALERLDEGGSGPVDAGPGYLRGLADGAKVLTLIRKSAEPEGSDTGPAVVVNLTVKASEKPDPDAA